MKINLPNIKTTSKYFEKHTTINNLYIKGDTRYSHTTPSPQNPRSIESLYQDGESIRMQYQYSGGTSSLTFLHPISESSLNFLSNEYYDVLYFDFANEAKGVLQANTFRIKMIESYLTDIKILENGVFEIPLGLPARYTGGNGYQNLLISTHYPSLTYSEMNYDETKPYGCQIGEIANLKIKHTGINSIEELKQFLINNEVEFIFALYETIVNDNITYNFPATALEADFISLYSSNKVNKTVTVQENCCFTYQPSARGVKELISGMMFNNQTATSAKLNNILIWGEEIIPFDPVFMRNSTIAANQPLSNILTNKYGSYKITLVSNGGSGGRGGNNGTFGDGGAGGSGGTGSLASFTIDYTPQNASTFIFRKNHFTNGVYTLTLIDGGNGGNGGNGGFFSDGSRGAAGSAGSVSVSGSISLTENIAGQSGNQGGSNGAGASAKMPTAHKWLTPTSAASANGSAQSNYNYPTLVLGNAGGGGNSATNGGSGAEGGIIIERMEG